jgi:3-oxoacyl-[acyl-carrier protein] reductase
MNEMMLKDRVAIVTGASKEIGAEMASALARAGAAVVLGYFGAPLHAEETARQIEASGGRAVIQRVNTQRVADCYGVVEAAVRAFGRLDIMAANAGITRFGKFLDFDEATYDEVMDTNLKGCFFLAQAAAKQMIGQARDDYGGRIVFSSSIVSLVGVPALAAYGATKAGINYLARALAVDLGRYGITVNSIAIGATVNERNLRDDPNYAENFARVLPIGRVLYPSDAAAALMYLVSPGASSVTGHTLVVDGGHSLTVASSGSPQSGGDV